MAAPKTFQAQEDIGLYNVRQDNPTGGLNAATLNAAVAHANSLNKMVFLTPGIWTLEADVTIPATRGLFVPKTATINKNGNDLLVQGPLWVSHDDTSWHTGSGTFHWTHKRMTQSGGVNVKEYGARVDGVTDDTAALNACLAENSHVFIPEGVLLHNGTIVINIGNRLSGVWTGADAATKSDSDGYPYMSGSSLHYTGSGVAVEALFADSVDGQLHVDNLQIYSGTGTVALHIKNAIDVWIDHVNITGITWPLTTEGFSVAGMHFEQSLLASAYEGTVRVTHSMVRYLAGYGIKVDGGNNLNGYTIAGNHIQGNELGGIYCAGQAMGWDIGGNVIEGNGSGQPAGQGYQIYSYYPTAWHIHGNHLEPNAGNAAPLILLERAQGVGIYNNILFGNPTGTRTPYLVRLGKLGDGLWAKSVTIQGNRLGNAVAAFHPEFCQGLTIRENNVFVRVDREISTVTPCTIEGFTYQSMTYDSPLDPSNPDTVIESTPTIAGMRTTVVTFASSTAENTLYSQLVPGKTLQATSNMAGGFRFHLHGGVANASGGPMDVTFRFKYGGVTLNILRYLAIPNAGGAYALVLRGHVFGSMGFPGNQDGQFEGLLGGADTVKNTVLDAAPILRLGVPYAGTPGADPYADQTFVVTAQMSVSHATAVVNINSAYLERMPY